MRGNHLYYPYPYYPARNLTALSGAGMQALRLAGVGFATGLARLLR